MGAQALKKALAAAFLLLAAVLPARAVFTRSTLDRIDTEPLFDSEYFADLLGFSYPLAWDGLWSGSSIAYRNNGASLDCCDLLWQQDLKFAYNAAPGLLFKWRLERNEDKDRSDLHHWLEFEQALPGGFYAEIFGEPTKDKEDADIGIGASFRPDSRFSLSARHNFVDFNFNSRGDSSKRYNRKPSSDELRMDFSRDGLKSWARLEIDHPTRLQILNDRKTQSYRRTVAGAGARFPLYSDFAATVEYGYEFLKRGSLTSPDPGAVSEDFSRQAHRIFAALEIPLNDKDRLEAGQQLMIRTARNDNPSHSQRGVFYRRWEVSPFARWRRLINAHAETELAAFLSFGENRRRFPAGQAPSVYGTLVEAKLGAGIDWVFTPKARLGFYGHFDLDDLLLHPWDGGAVRALFLF